MAQPPDEPYAWITRAGALTTIAVAGWAVIRGYFSLVPKKELVTMMQAMAEAQKERDAATALINTTRHNENLGHFNGMYLRLSALETNVGEIRGELRARFGGGE